MNTRKICLSIGLLAVFLLTPFNDTFALENNQTLSIENAVATALEQNSNLKLSLEKIKSAERDLKLTLGNVDFYTKADWKSGAERQNNAKEAYLAPIQKLNQLNALNRELENAKTELKVKVLEEYYSVVKLKEEQKGKQAQLKTAVQDLSNRKAEFKLGKTTALEVTKAETTVKEFTNVLSGIENDLQIAFLNLNSTIEEDLENKYVLTTGIPADQKIAINDIAAAVKTDKAMNLALLSSKEKVVELEKEIEVVTNYSASSIEKDSSANTDTSDLELALKDAKFKVQMTDLQIGYQLRIDYNNLLNQYDQLEIAKINVSLSEKSLAIAKVKLSVGTINQVTYLNALTDLENSKNGLLQKQIDYHIALNKFKMTHKL